MTFFSIQIVIVSNETTLKHIPTFCFTSVLSLVTMVL